MLAEFVSTVFLLPCPNVYRFEASAHVCTSWQQALMLSSRQTVAIICLLHSSSCAFLFHNVPCQYSTSNAWSFGLKSRSTPSLLTGVPTRGDESYRPHLNVIIPAYNEASRITRTLESYTSYLESNWPSCTILVVDDGSVDACADVVNKFAETVPTVLCVSLPQNCGKGVAISKGIASVDGGETPQLILTADADGSADLSSVEELFSELDRLVQSNWDTPAMVAGYRTYDERAIGRLVFRWGFRTTVRIVCGDLGCSDTQCGFKLMTLPAAMSLYSSLHLRRWSHDVEVLMRAGILGIQVTEAPVRWVDQQGSKLVDEGILKVTAQMFVDVLRCRLAYVLGVWIVER